MKSRDFCYWLQGFFEISESNGIPVDSLDAKKIEMVRRHLNMVFVRDIDPTFGKDNPILDAVHQGQGLVTARC